MEGELSSQQVIELLELEPLAGEGGWFRREWTSPHGSAIYFLLRPGDFSALHRLTGPELWHHYAGATVRLVLLRPDGSGTALHLGDDLDSGERPLAVVEAGTWMGAETCGEWSLLGTTMAPPFDPEGFSLGRREDLLRQYPHMEKDILRLTRTA